MKDWKKKKVAVYIRRSKGESGDTKSQLNRIKKQIQKLVKDGKIKNVDFNIVGKDFDQKDRFNPARDLSKQGDVFNEGDGKSAFGNAKKRPVLNELLRRMREGQYDAVIAESLDRFSRDPLDFATVALDLWREEDKQFASLTESVAYGSKNQLHEPIIKSHLK